MPSYLVTWNIDIEAETAEEAALTAVAIQRKPDTTAVVFWVTDKSSGVATTIDLQREDDCGPCNCRGWDVFNADPAIGELGEIQRCDDCKILRDDLVARDAARAAGFTVDDQGRIAKYPPSFSLDTWRQKRWPAQEPVAHHR